MGKAVVFLFPGQGSQYYRMGKELFLTHSVFRNWMLEMNDTYRKLTGLSVLDVLYDKDKAVSTPFQSLAYTHPAIFMVEYATARLVDEQGIRPDAVLGVSLGEFAACTVAGVLDYREALEGIAQQADAIERYCAAGGMLAVLAPYGLFDKEASLHRHSELAGIHYDEHFVVSGTHEGLEVVERFLLQKRIVFQRLPISYAFHSSLIDGASSACLDFWKGRPLRKPRVAYVSGLQGGPLASLQTGHHWRMIRQPIRFREAMGVWESEEEALFIDMGPSGTLSNFAKQSLGVPTGDGFYQVLSPYSNDRVRLAKLVSQFSNGA